jgi:tripartite ATP-independent transporter DctM subunit
VSPAEIGVLGLGVLLVLLFLGVPVGIGLAAVGFVGFAAVSGLEPALGVIRIVPYATFSNYGLIVIPLFILMGNFAFHSGLSADLFLTARAWFGRVRGGLAMAAIAASAAFAAISGSSVATAATMGKISLPEMKRHGYDDGLATGTLAAGGTIGILIPPSVIMIIYGVITENSIGKLFLAGFIPGILQAIMFIILIGLLCLFRPKLGPPAESSSLWEKIKSLKGSWMVLALFLLVIGGIYIGVFSPVEAAGIGAFGAFFIALVRRRLTWAKFKDSCTDALGTAAMIFLIMLGANIFGYFLAVTGLPQALADAMLGLEVSRWVIFAIIMVVYIVLGMFMDSMAMILITVPIFYPVAMQLGFDPIWFGIVIVVVCEIGLITPPVGMNLYVIKGISEAPMGTVFRGATPFVLVDFLFVVVLAAFPILATYLPSIM